MKLWNSLWLFLKLTLLNHLKKCIKNIINKNNSIWEVECMIGKVSLQDGQNLKETCIISGFIKGKTWVQCRLLFDKPEGRWFPWVWYSTLPEEHTISNSTKRKEKNQLENEMLYFSHHNKVTRRTFWYKRFQLGKNSLKNQAFLVKFHFCNLPYSTLVWSTSVTKNSNLRVAEVMLFHYHRSALKKYSNSNSN